MTPGDLYERVVALGLCERAKFRGIATDADECEDLCAMTVLRALMDSKNHQCALATSNERDTNEFVVSRMDTDGDGIQYLIDPIRSKSLLESLCLCLLRAKGHDVESGNT